MPPLGPGNWNISMIVEWEPGQCGSTATLPGGGFAYSINLNEVIDSRRLISTRARMAVVRSGWRNIRVSVHNDNAAVGRPGLEHGPLYGGRQRRFRTGVVVTITNASTRRARSGVNGCASWR